MLPEYSRTKSESLAQISTAMAKIQIFFYGTVFYWRTLYTLTQEVMQSLLSVRPFPL